MKSKSIIALTATLILSFLVSSCEVSDDCGPFVSELVVTDLYVQTVNLKSIDNSYANFTSLSSGDSVSTNQLALYITPFGEAASLSKTESFQIRFSHLAYACSPPVQEFQGYIDELEILSDNNVGENFPAGSNLSQLFDIYVLNRSKNLYYSKLDLQSYLDTNPDTPDEFFLVLKASVNVSGKHGFTIKYYQSDGHLDHYTFTVNTVYLK